MFRWAPWKGSAARLLSRVANVVAAVLVGWVLVGGLPGAAHASVQPVIRPYTLTQGRLLASTAALVGLSGMVIGALALARARAAGRIRTGNGRRGAIVALVLAS